jgi:hypothetical protein
MEFKNYLMPKRAISASIMYEDVHGCKTETWPFCNEAIASTGFHYSL